MHIKVVAAASESGEVYKDFRKFWRMEAESNLLRHIVVSVCDLLLLKHTIGQKFKDNFVDYL